MNATIPEVKAAYQQLCSKYAADRLEKGSQRLGAQFQFQMVQEAYSFLVYKQDAARYKREVYSLLRKFAGTR